jgi:pheromone shutdown protein TraB
VVILFDILNYNLNRVVLTYKLINLGSSVGAFLLICLCLIYLVSTFTNHLFTALGEYQL